MYMEKSGQPRDMKAIFTTATIVEERLKTIANLSNDYSPTIITLPRQMSLAALIHLCILTEYTIANPQTRKQERRNSCR